MEEGLSFMNWGFAPSKNASGWILHWSSSYWYSDMGPGDVYNYPGFSCSLEKPFKDLAFEILWDKLNYYLYEMDNVDYIVIDRGGLELGWGDYSLNIMGDSVRFPTDLEFWFPILIAEDIPEEDYRETIEPIMEDDGWLQEGIRKLIEQTVGEITNAEIVQKVENKELNPMLTHFSMGDYDNVTIDAIHLQKLRS